MTQSNRCALAASVLVLTLCWRCVLSSPARPGAGGRRARRRIWRRGSRIWRRTSPTATPKALTPSPGPGHNAWMMTSRRWCCS